MWSHYFARLFTAFAVFSVLALAAKGQPAKLQNKPDLSGAWLLNAKKSDSTGLTSRPDLPIKISHLDPKFQITLASESKGQIVGREYIYFTDGRGETNPATTALTTNPSPMKPDDLKNQVTKSKTNWSGNKIVIRSILRLTAGGRIVEFEQIDEWKLSTDGKVLSQITRVVPETGVGIFIMAYGKKRVYNRV